MELIVGLPIQVDDINEAINQVTAWMNKELFGNSNYFSLYFYLFFQFLD